MNKRTFYYQIAREASLDIGTHPGLLFLKKTAVGKKKILDLGCGEGSRLNLMANGKPGWGIDIDKYAIKLAKEQYPIHNFRTYSGDRLPYQTGTFDLVYSAFVLEHTQDPVNFINEAIRVIKPGGELVLLCPNFGAPNRRSPNSIESPSLKLIGGFFADFQTDTELDWKKVKPKKNYKNIDDDTTVEPYLGSLVSYLKQLGLEVRISRSLWELEPWSVNPRKFLFALLGKLGLYPFSMWGPQIFVSAKKL